MTHASMLLTRLSDKPMTSIIYNTLLVLCVIVVCALAEIYKRNGD